MKNNTSPFLKFHFKTVHGSHEGIDKQVYTNNVIPLEDMKKIGRRFMGAGMSQSYSAIYWQEYFIESNRFQYIVELGSQKGALSTYLANMAAITESYFFDTYEEWPHRSYYKLNHINDTNESESILINL